MTPLPGPAPTPRANREGDPCPAWCTADHQTPIDGTGLYFDSHRSDTGKVATSGGNRDDHVTTGAAQPGSTDSGIVWVMVSRLGSNTLIMQRDQAGAAELAAFLEQLGGATRAQLKRIAADVRAAASLTAHHGTSEEAGPAAGTAS